MNETCTNAAQLINSTFEGAGFDLRASAEQTETGCLLSIEGADAELLLSQGGELLDALQQIINQVFGRSLPKGQRIICDARNYRAAREAELRAMAQHAARQVRTTSAAFVFGPMEASERRVIHLSLADEEDLLTESIGEGIARRLRVSLRPSARAVN
jgi:spoIIIJ-associated protein